MCPLGNKPITYHLLYLIKRLHVSIYTCPPVHLTPYNLTMKDQLCHRNPWNYPFDVMRNTITRSKPYDFILTIWRKTFCQSIKPLTFLCSDHTRNTLLKHHGSTFFSFTTLWQGGCHSIGPVSTSLCDHTAEAIVASQKISLPSVIWWWDHIMRS